LLKLKCDILVSKFHFKFNLYRRYGSGNSVIRLHDGALAALQRYHAVGAVHVDSPRPTAAHS
jgi:hypothetical protein